MYYQDRIIAALENYDQNEKEIIYMGSKQLRKLTLATEKYRDPEKKSIYISMKVMVYINGIYKCTRSVSITPRMRPYTFVSLQSHINECLMELST